MFSFYRAEIYIDAKCVAKLRGRFNNRQVLDKFIKEHWPGDLGWHPVEEWEEEMILKIYRYQGTSFYDICTTARMPKPHGYKEAPDPKLDIPKPE